MLEARSILHVARNDVRIMLRDRGTLFWSFLGPILFMLFFGVIFRSGGEPARTVLVLENQDRSSTLVQALALLLDDDKLDVRMASSDSTARQARYRLVVPAGSADSLAHGRPPRLVLHVPENDVTWDEQALRANVMRATMRAFLGLRPEDATVSLDSTAVRARVVFEPRIALVTHSLAATPQKMSAGFQRSVPAYLIMFLLMTLMTSGAEILVGERKSGQLRRTFVSSIAPSDVVLGKFLSRFGFAWLQIFVMLAVGILVFRVQVGSHPGALVAVLAAFALCATGIGLLFATLFENPDKAGGIGSLLVMPMAALGGCWWPLEIVPEWMRKISLVLPTGWGFDALNRVMALDSGLAPLRPHFAYLLAVAAVTLPLAARRIARPR
jgi:ABC-type Na+ efflux pump permease subunit